MTISLSRYARQYWLNQLPTHLAVVWGIALLLQSLVAFFFASVWRVSWWEYHVLALLGVATTIYTIYGLVTDYRRGPGIQKALAALLAPGSVRTLEESYTEVLTGLTAAIEARDPYTKGHSEKVARLAASMAERMGLTPEMVRGLYQAGVAARRGQDGHSRRDPEQGQQPHVRGVRHRQGAPGAFGGHCCPNPIPAAAALGHSLAS